MEHRIKLTVAYLGTPFAGWQLQNGQRTVQGELESALARVTGANRTPITGAGRTDAGVHARGQTAHLDLAHSPPVGKLAAVLNAALPPEISVRHAVVVPSTFHARRSARAKLYTYRIGWGQPPVPWAGLRRAHVSVPRDLDVLEEGLRLLIGRRDMASFTVPDPTQGPSVRTLLDAWSTGSRDRLSIHFLGNGFLRYQVRRMVGLLLEISWQRETLETLRRLITQPTPGAPVWTAPACGLTLEKVYYRKPGRPRGGNSERDNLVAG
ncbi:MAG: tRNA pseudouridine(38-40) synthase TruA [Acidobacteria bacterium]|nr:tRNA pseudouridine(38-40) synthase TruA [Acidobacteriota bacterium]